MIQVDRATFLAMCDPTPDATPGLSVIVRGRAEGYRHMSDDERADMAAWLRAHREARE